jgi:hypothetical protein
MANPLADVRAAILDDLIDAKAREVAAEIGVSFKDARPYVEAQVGNELEVRFEAGAYVLVPCHRVLSFPGPKDRVH